MQSDPAAEADQIARLSAWRGARDAVAVTSALEALRAAAISGANIMPASIAAAKAGATTGEWAAVARAAFGEYRAPTGVSKSPSNRTEGLEPIREAVQAVSAKLGRPLSFLVGKPGLDGHSNGAEQIAARARDCGMEIHYEGIRLTPAQITTISGSTLGTTTFLKNAINSGGTDAVVVLKGGVPIGSSVTDADGNELGTVGQGSRALVRVQTNKDQLKVVWGDKPDETCWVAYALDEKQTANASGFTNLKLKCEVAGGAEKTAQTKE
jgi:methylmalonyl-CoA mutase cobalamin-binding domain/chain